VHITAYISVTTLWMASNYTWNYSFTVARYCADHGLMDAKVRGRVPVIKQTTQIFWHYLLRALWLNYTVHTHNNKCKFTYTNTILYRTCMFRRHLRHREGQLFGTRIKNCGIYRPR